MCQDSFSVDVKTYVGRGRGGLEQLAQELLEAVSPHRLAVDEIRLLEDLLDAGRQSRVETTLSVERVGLASRSLLDQILNHVLRTERVSVCKSAFGTKGEPTDRSTQSRAQ